MPAADVPTPDFKDWEGNQSDATDSTDSDEQPVKGNGMDEGEVVAHDLPSDGPDSQPDSEGADMGIATSRNSRMELIVECTR